MMKTYKILLISLIISLFFACNPDEWLGDVEMDINQVTTEFDNYQLFDNFTRAAYFNLKSPGDYGIIDFNIIRTVMSDLVVQHPSTTNLSYENIYNRDYQSNDDRPVMFGIDGAFTVLQAANRVINFWEDNPNAEFEADPYKPLIDHMIGECHFLRAYAHFMMALVFAPPFQSDPDGPGIIMRTKISNSATDYKARSTNRAVYEQIIKDLITATNLLRDQYDSSMPEDFQDRLFKPAAQALLARVYYVMGEEYWDRALEQANAVIGSNKFPLVPGNELFAVFNERGLGLKKSETIWYTSYYFRNAWRGPRYERHFSVRNNKARGYAFSQAILDKIGWDDETEAQNDLRYSQLYLRYNKGEDPAYPDQYERDYYVWTIRYNSHISNFVNLRATELYLIRANINFKKDNTQPALNDVNTLRVRAGLPELGSLTMADLEKEWIKEMAFEQGSRLLFLQANKMDVPPGDRGGVSNIPYNSEQLVMVYPENETARNPKANEVE
jgi:hypothetical protein